MKALVTALALLAGCGTQGYERGLAATIPHDGHFGGRGWFGMPRGRAGRWVTEAVVLGHIDGFVAAAGGIAYRKARGWSPRVGAAFGVGGRRLAPDLDGKDGLSPYVEAQLGVDAPLSPTLFIDVSLLGSAYLNGEEIEPHVMAMVGILWK